MSSKALIVAGAILLAGAATIPAVSAQDVTDPAPATETDQPTAKERPIPFRAAVMFSILDTNGDGEISSEEIVVLQTAMFNALDADGSGSLSQQEIGKMMQGFGRDGYGRGHGPRSEFHQRGRGRDYGEDHRGPRYRHHDQRGKGQTAERSGPPRDRDGMMERGAVDQDPAANRGSHIFAEIDADGDGVVTIEEFQVAAAKFQQRWLPN